jgi:2,3-bisphosphoglycerate-dependent phosphoglycerate mutase
MNLTRPYSGLVAIEIVYETHSLTEDNERGIATGWHPGRLSPRGRELAAGLGRRHGSDRLAAVFSSDLARAAETASIAFAGSSIPVLFDWRLRECDYGIHNATPPQNCSRTGRLVAGAAGRISFGCERPRQRA